MEDTLKTPVRKYNHAHAQSVVEGIAMERARMRIDLKHITHAMEGIAEMEKDPTVARFLRSLIKEITHLTA